jgi:hypothetical protein
LYLAVVAMLVHRRHLLVESVVWHRLAIVHAVRSCLYTMMTYPVIVGM